MKYLLLLLIGVSFILLCMREDRTEALDTPCPTDLNDSRASDIQDVTSFLAPIRHLDTSPGNPNFDAKWDLVPGPNGLAEWINIQDLIQVVINYGWCDTPVRYLSKLLDFDAQYNANPTAGAAMMNANYEAVMTFDCGICRQFGNAFNGTTFVYQDPTKICGPSDPFCSPECEGEQPGTDCSDVLQGTGTCWQKFFSNERYLADVTQEDVRDEIVAKAIALEAESAFDGIYIDVAEAWLPNAVEGCVPAVTNAQWLSGWATLVERLQNEVNGPLILNSQYTTWNNLKNTSVADSDKFWAAADAVEIEFGWIDCRHGCETVAGAADYLAYLDKLHSLGTAVYTQDYDGDHGDFTAAQETFGLAMYLITREPADYYGTFSHDGQGTGFIWSQNYGEALGPRESCGSGCYQRLYEGGLIQANVVTKTGAIP